MNLQAFYPLPATGIIIMVAMVTIGVTGGKEG
jgi:hypothetical protein